MRQSITLLAAFAALALLAGPVAVGNAASIEWSYEELAQDGSNVATDGDIWISIAYGSAYTADRLINGVSFQTGEANPPSNRSRGLQLVLANGSDLVIRAECQRFSRVRKSMR